MRALLLAALLSPSPTQADVALRARAWTQIFDTACQILVSRATRAEATRRFGRDPHRTLGPPLDEIPLHPERRIRLVPPEPEVREVILDVNFNDDDRVDVIEIRFVKPRALGELRRLFPTKRESYPLTDVWHIAEIAFGRNVAGQVCELTTEVPTAHADDMRQRVETVSLALPRFYR